MSSISVPERLRWKEYQKSATERDLPQAERRKRWGRGTLNKQKGTSTNPTQKYMLGHTITELNAKAKGKGKEN